MLDFILTTATLTNGAGLTTMAATTGQSLTVKSAQANGACILVGAGQIGAVPKGLQISGPIPGLLPTGLTLTGNRVLTADGMNMHRIDDVPIPESVTLTVKGAA